MRDVQRCLGFDLDLSLKAGVEVTGNVDSKLCSKKGMGQTGKYDLTYQGKKKEEMSMRTALSL